ncbi:MAG: hypothetical protein Q8736_02725, partial [Sweet potato little leaf phytoplasma]|nr:hypothetical protein [Sweet potato little leaf phytoplasma]
NTLVNHNVDLEPEYATIQQNNTLENHKNRSAVEFCKLIDDRHRSLSGRLLLQHKTTIFSQCPNGEYVSICSISDHAILVEHSHYFLKTTIVR